jgi:hypothetical protein
MNDFARRALFGAPVFLLIEAALAPAPAVAVDSIVQFKVAATATRLSHDLKIEWTGPIDGTQCSTVTVAPTTDKFPGEGMSSVKLSVNSLTNLWLKAGDTIKADDAGCSLLVTALYTDATFTRPATP